MPKRLALVTGGVRGIGAAIATQLANDGYLVAATYHHPDPEHVHAFEKEAGVKAFQWDVSDREACIKGVAKVAKAFKQPVDVLVNNAGITRDSMMHKMAEEDWNAVLHTNLFSCFYMCQAVIGEMRANNYGRIVNISSINAQTGQLGQTNYCAAKAGMLGLTKALALESASKGITVNAIAPGYIKTDMTNNVPRAFMQQIIDKVPVKRLGFPEEIARVVSFLASEAAGYITGETISVNGGLHIE